MDVLVVDDEDVVRELMVEILERAGYVVGGAATAEEALEFLAGDDVSVVVTDAIMPRFSGFELIQELHRRRPGLPVIVATGASTDQTIVEARAAGAQNVITKPFTHRELISAVEEALAVSDY